MAEGRPVRPEQELAQVGPLPDKRPVPRQPADEPHPGRLGHVSDQVPEPPQAVDRLAVEADAVPLPVVRVEEVEPLPADRLQLPERHDLDHPGDLPRAASQRCRSRRKRTRDPCTARAPRPRGSGSPRRTPSPGEADRGTTRTPRVPRAAPAASRADELLRQVPRVERQRLRLSSPRSTASSASDSSSANLYVATKLPSDSSRRTLKRNSTCRSGSGGSISAATNAP